MKKRQNLILESFGAENIPNPNPHALSKWILEEKRSCCDLLSYKIECQIKDQKNYVDFPCVGGIFYRQRITESLSCIKSGFLTGEPDADLEYFRYDSERIYKYSKKSGFAFPPPSELGIDDAYYNDRADFIGSLCYAYRKIMREQRDYGTKKHLMLSNRFDAAELDELSRERVFFFSPAGESKTLKSILEYQNIIAIMPEKLPVIFELLNEYEIKKIAVINGRPENYDKCLEYFDPENIISGGFCNNSGDDYWENLKERAFIMR
ncbi:MAG: hypothetical protein PHV39_07640 [Methanomicrobium sp.]|nr:hypothetical protein [Methanomicrobium sp.]